MSADISVFKNTDMDDVTLLPEGFYVGAFRGEQCEEATGPYPTQDIAVTKMTTAGGCVWLYGDPTVGNYTWDHATKRFIIKPDHPILVALRAQAEPLTLRGSDRPSDAPDQGHLF